jgi:hypothetical protein
MNWSLRHHDRGIFTWLGSPPQESKTYIIHWDLYRQALYINGRRLRFSSHDEEFFDEEATQENKRILDSLALWLETHTEWPTVSDELKKLIGHSSSVDTLSA